MAWPSALARTKDWGTEIMTDADLEGQLDLIITYINAMMDLTTGHKHDATGSEGPKILTANVNDAAGAQGDVYFSSGTAISRLPAAASVGQYLRSGGAGADPTWGNAGWDFVAVTNGAAVAAIEFAALEAGYDYLFAFANIKPADDSKKLLIRTAASTGVFDNGPNEYTDSNGSGDQNQIVLTPSLGNETGVGTSMSTIAWNPGGSLHTHITSAGMYFSAATGTIFTVGQGGSRISAAAVVDVQFLWESGGNFAAEGSIAVYRRKRA